MINRIKKLILSLDKKRQNKKRILYQSYLKSSAFSYIDQGMVNGYRSLGAETVFYDAKTDSPPLKKILTKFQPTHFIGFLQECNREVSRWTENDHFNALKSYRDQKGLVVCLRSFPTNMTDYVQNYLKVPQEIRKYLTDFYSQPDRPVEVERKVLSSGFIDFFRSPLNHKTYAIAFKNLLDQGFSILEEPHAADVIQYLPSNEDNDEQGILYIGGAWDFKLRHMRPYIDKLRESFPSRFDLYGKGWPEGYSKGFISDKQYTNLVRSAQINIALHEPTQVLPYSVNSGNERIFKLLAMKKFVISDNNPLLNYLFEIGLDLEVTGNPTEMVDKCNYYLEHYDKAKLIAEQGYKKVLKEHTYTIRAKRLLDVSQDGFYTSEQIIKYK